MNGKFLGKIQQIDLMESYGHILLSVELGSDNGEGNWGVHNTYQIIPGPKVPPHDWDIFPLAQYMQDARVDVLSKLKGKPIEAIFEGNILKEWRILKEVV